MKAVVVALFWSTSFALLACSSESTEAVDAGSEHDSIYPSCNTISHACHAYDDGTPGPIHDCHEVAHDDPTEPACVSKLAHCLAVCSGDGGVHDAGSGGH